jgi:hypothetical protein
MNCRRRCENHWRWTPHSRANGLIEYSMRVSGFIALMRANRMVRLVFPLATTILSQGSPCERNDAGRFALPRQACLAHHEATST